MALWGNALVIHCTYLAISVHISLLERRHSCVVANRVGPIPCQSSSNTSASRQKAITLGPRAIRQKKAGEQIHRDLPPADYLVRCPVQYQRLGVSRSTVRWIKRFLLNHKACKYSENWRLIQKQFCSQFVYGNILMKSINQPSFVITYAPLVLNEVGRLQSSSFSLRKASLASSQDFCRAIVTL